MGLPVESGADEVRAHPRHTGRARLDLVLALAAIFISVVSLVVAVEHGRTERDLLAASTWPFLEEVGEEGPDDPDGSTTLVNAGVGPAKLATLRLFLDGKPVPDVDAFVRLCCGADPAVRRAFVSSNVENSVLRAGQTDVILRFHDPGAAPAQRRAVAGALNRLGFEACYCSVFDRCWVSDLNTIRPEPVAACPARTDSFNQHYFR